MTDILPGFGHFLGRSTPFSMPQGGAGHDWRGPPQSAYNQLPMLTNGWSDDPHGSQVVGGGMQDVDLAMFQHPTPRYHESLAAAPGAPSSTSYAFPSDPNNPSFHHADVDMRTPSSAGYPTDVGTGEYPVSLPSTSSNGYLRAPIGGHGHGHGHGSISAPSPRVKGGEIAPRLTAVASDPTGTAKLPRPSLPRSATAPESGGETTAQTGKRATGSDGEDEDYNPQEDVKNRGRKRQRIPHTAVERRYRENLNAHLDRLRQQVPALSGRSGNELGGGHEGVKPSKCEILNGAIEHISSLDRENQALKNEVKLLKARYDELDRFYRGNPPGGPYGA